MGRDLPGPSPRHVLVVRAYTFGGLLREPTGEPRTPSLRSHSAEDNLHKAGRR